MRELALVAYQPDFPHNLGAMVRLCACFAASLHVIEPCGFPLSSRALRDAALDYGGQVDMQRHATFSAFADHWPGRLVALSTGGTRPLRGFAFRRGDALVMGRESAGLPAAVIGRSDAVLRIPIAASARSLNVATAAGIALAEARHSVGFGR